MRFPPVREGWESLPEIQFRSAADLEMPLVTISLVNRKKYFRQVTGDGLPESQTGPKGQACRPRVRMMLLRCHLMGVCNG